MQRRVNPLKPSHHVDSDTLALTTERQSARIPEIKTVKLGLYAEV